MKITRTEKWKLRTTPQDRDVFLDTITLYQRYVRAVSSVCFTHWTTIGPLKGSEVIQVIEGLIHPTKNRPVVRYAYFNRVILPNQLAFSNLLFQNNHHRQFHQAFSSFL